jgi:predicted permease
MFQDLRYCLRVLLKQPGFTLIAVLTLALGIGANTAIFTLLDKVLIRRLPVDRPEQLVTFVEDAGGTPAILSFPAYTDIRDRNDVFAGVVGFFQQPFSLSDGRHTERVVGQIVSSNYFDVLGVRPAAGRFFLAEEDRTPGTHPVAVISHGLWRRHFDGLQPVLGRTVGLNGRQYTIVGVTPAEFTGTTRGTVNEIYVPMMMSGEAARGCPLDNRNCGWLTLIARLNTDVTRAQAQAALAATATTGTVPVAAPDRPRVFLMDGSRGHTDRVRDIALPMKLLMGVVAFVLLIACANVANLLLGRASARRKEIAVRLASGASRWRIVRQLLTESTVLAIVGATGGLLVAQWSTGVLLGFQQRVNFVPRTFQGGLDGRALGFTLGLALLTGFVFGLLPALQASRPDFAAALKGDAAGIGGARRLSLRNLLVVVQVALSLVVLIGAALCVQSLRALQSIDPGFEPAKVVTASFSLGLNGYDESRGRQFISQLGERAAALPRVEAVSFARIVAFSGVPWIGPALVEGAAPQPVNFNAIGPNYFQTLGIPIVRGRDFSIQDSAGAPRAFIVNEAMARKFWPGQDALGKALNRGRIVGIVRDTKERGLTEDPRPTLYEPLQQNYMPDLTVHVRAAADARTLTAALAREVQTLDATLPIYDAGTLQDQRNGALYSEHIAATLLALFGLLALSLAAIGIYGVLSNAVTERTREMGIRLTQGAQPCDLLALVIGHGMVLTGIGLAVGTAASLGLTRLVGSLLFGISATDPSTFVAVPLLLTCVALLACWLPARRATRLDPAIALRYE